MTADPRYIVARHFNRWAVKDILNPDLDGRKYDTREAAEVACERKNEAGR